MITKAQIKTFLLTKRGYLKKSPVNVARAIWLTQPHSSTKKTTAEVTKELAMIKEVQATLRAAKTYVGELVGKYL